MHWMHIYAKWVCLHDLTRFDSNDVVQYCVWCYKRSSLRVLWLPLQLLPRPRPAVLLKHCGIDSLH